VSAASSLLGLSIGVIGGTITFTGREYPSLAAFIRAVATEDSVNILSTPQILTINNEEAEIVVGENRPYLTTSRLDSAGNPINTFDYRDVGVKLKVKPYINKDGLVYLTLYQEVTKVTEATVGSGVAQQPAPTTLKRSTKTTVGVKDSQTIVISGLIRDDSSGRRQGIVPLRNPCYWLPFRHDVESIRENKPALFTNLKDHLQRKDHRGYQP
jgi:general secretion pathway protein D